MEPFGVPCDPDIDVFKSSDVMTKEDAPVSVYNETDASVTALAFPFFISCSSGTFFGSRTTQNHTLY